MMKKFTALFLAILTLLGAFPLLTSATGTVVLPPSTSTPAGEERYNVLVLDNSASMDGDPLMYLKEAASNFCLDLLKTNTNQHVAIVVYDEHVVEVCHFTNSQDELLATIERMDGYGDGTNIYEATEEAYELLMSVDADIRNMVIMTDGLPNRGESNYSGRYEDWGWGSNYAYGSALYDLVVPEMHKNCNVYTLGYFHNMTSSKKEFGAQLLQDIQNAGYYEVIDSAKLDFAFGQLATEMSEKPEPIEFRYQSGQDYTAICYFSESYFKDSAYSYNPSLSTMSLSLAMSAFGSGDTDDYTKKSQNAEALLTKIAEMIGSELAFSTNDWYTKKPTKDSIGVVVGSMPITVNGNTETLIAVAVRGGGYESEWASNFTIGSSGQHQGFNEAKNEVLAHLRKHIKDNGITGDVKLWITGFSRAAATANLLAGDIDSGVNLGTGLSYTNDDVYAYCFETPAGALTHQVSNNYIYNNIFNIINPNDPVPYVAPTALGFCRYGIDRYLPTEATSSYYKTLKQDMLAAYEKMGGAGEYIVDDFSMTTLELEYILPGGQSPVQHYPQSVFLSTYVSMISDEIIEDRNNYVANYQDELREILGFLMGDTDEKNKEVQDAFVNKFLSKIGLRLLLKIQTRGITRVDLYDIVYESLEETAEEQGMKHDDAMLERVADQLTDVVLELIVRHPVYFFTLLKNLGCIGEAHFPQLCFAWMSSMDINYDPSANAPNSTMNSGAYRIVRINCPVDVEVYDEAGNLVAVIANETPEQVGESTIASAINEDGEKIVILPADAEYEFEVTGREDSLVSIGIDEYSAAAGNFVLAVDYFDIDLKAGETLNATMPAYMPEELADGAPNGSTAAYQVLDPDGNEIDRSSVLRGQQATAAYHMVTATSANPEAGTVIGSGKRQFGNYAQLEAVPNADFEFDGWYIGDERVSEDLRYRFRVETDVELIARFRSATGAHVYEKPVFRWAPDHSTCTATFTCVDKDDEQTLDCTVTSEYVPGVGNQVGKTVYTATVEFNGQTYTDVQFAGSYGGGGGGGGGGYTTSSNDNDSGPDAAFWIILICSIVIGLSLIAIPFLLYFLLRKRK